MFQVTQRPQLLRRFFLEHGVTLVVLSAILCGLFLLKDQLAVDRIVRGETQIRDSIELHPIRTFISAVVLYSVACFLPGTNGKSILTGWLFGPLVGGLLTNFASAFAAFGQFLLARYWFRDRLGQRFGTLRQSVSKAVDRGGVAYAIGIRLVPVFPFTAINALLGLSEIDSRTFWWTTQVGMLPANLLFAYAGSTLPDISKAIDQGPLSLLNIQFVFALLALGLFPLVARFAIRRFQQGRNY